MGTCLILMVLVNIGAVIALLLILSNDVEFNPGPDKHKPFKIGHNNIRGLRSNFVDLKVMLSSMFDIFCISETMLSSHVENSTIRIPGYQMPLRKDRDHNGGGLLVYISNNVSVTRRPDLESSTIETLWLEVKAKGLKFLVCNCYRPPNSGIEFWDVLQSQLDRVKHSSIRNVILLGDLNADPGTITGRYLKTFVAQNHMFLHIDKPTRFTSNTQTCLDQIISNMPFLLRNVLVEAPIGKSDHCVIMAELGLRVEKRNCYQRKIWNYNRADYDKFRTELENHNWDNCFSSDCVETSCKQWTHDFLSIAEKCIPNKTVTIRPNDLPWYNSSLRKLKKYSDRSHAHARKHYTPSSWENYRRNRNKYFNELHAAEQDYYNKLAVNLKEDNKSNPKHWRKTVKFFLGRNSDCELPPIYDGNQYHFTNTDKAEAFNNFFLKNTMLDTQNSSLPDITETPNRILSSINATEKDVIDILKSLDVNKATGPDKISAKMLREASTAIAKPLTRLINMSLNKMVFPDEWKLANVLPLYKKNDKTSVNNYRPISLLSCVSKVMERVVFKYTFNYIRDQGLLSSFQSGFTPGDSTTNQLLHVYHLLCEALDHKKEVRLVFCDISKAFDRVWHDGLLHKLEKIGITGKLLLWFGSYLTNRRQRVTIGNATSHTGTISAGVPQGSVLGPLLFLIFINDIVENIGCNIRLFADDTTLFIDFHDEATGTNMINRDLLAIKRWADKWLVSFCPQKTESMLVTLKNNRDTSLPIYFGDSTIHEVDSHKHLGITLSKNLSWGDHVQDIVTKAGKRVDILAFLMYRLDRNTLEIIYKTFIRPILEYGDVLLCNMTEEQSQMIEQVNKRAGSIISGAIRGTSSNVIYNELGWATMESRRKSHRLVTFHKIINGKTPDYLRNCLPQRVRDTTSYSLRDADNLVTMPTRIEIYYKSFFPATVRDWNALSPNVRNIVDHEKFREALAKEMPCRNKLYSYGHRKTSILHSRIRMGCSALTGHLYNYHVVENPRCDCGAPMEDSFHYFFECPRFIIQRDAMMVSIAEITNCTIGTLLFGNDCCTLDENKAVFDIVHKYINDTYRFR